MTIKISKEEAKTPDKVLETLNRSFQWSQTHSKLLISAIVIFVVVGGGTSIYSVYSEKKETQAQEGYFKFEKSYLDKKRDFEEATRPFQRPDQKPEEKKAKATGDLDKDYGPEVAGFNQVLEKFAHSKAAQMAALNLSDIYLNYKKADEALQALKKVENDSLGKDLISVIVQTQLGNVLAETDDCKGAISEWERVLNNSQATFMHDALRLKSAFCYEKMNDTAKAEELYKKVAQSVADPKDAEAGEASFGKEAEKFLRLLKLKKAAEVTKGS